MSKRTRRSFSASFKAEVVLSLISGQKTQAEICRAHELSPALVSQWKEAFLANASSVFSDPDQRSDDSAKLAEVERLVGRLTWENDALKKGSALLQRSRKQGGGS